MTKKVSVNWREKSEDEWSDEASLKGFDRLSKRQKKLKKEGKETNLLKNEYIKKFIFYTLLIIIGSFALQISLYRSIGKKLQSIDRELSSISYELDGLRELKDISDGLEKIHMELLDLDIEISGINGKLRDVEKQLIYNRM